ncbi:DUF501 domain-containing protein [Mucisphaera calidilacus]|uniref:DUF501 domain-containing protein n=1 Tax=Mucisphaera calidilacus TaxID=2527982 RepID=A0A518C063_9BACT|nr:DUF501 domain-containing protein [Mucisphaera calidilacus]QDU72610.1 hypothetical protein Pan265_24810 [Mucisphaera calidilacus]
MISAADLERVAEQLGRRPRAVLRVAARRACGEPVVIETYPAVRGGDGVLRPFPTLFWLTDPVLNGAIGRAESAGGIARLEGVLREDEALAAGLAEDHRCYAARRWGLVSEADRAELVERGCEEVARDSGIGGIAGGVGLKCLHLHGAHHLAELAEGMAGTTVGMLMERELGVGLSGIVRV